MNRLSVVETNQLNSAVAWAIVAVLVAAAGASVATGEPFWAVFAAGGLAIVVLPAAVTRDPSVMPPWEILVFVALPVANQFFRLSDTVADLVTFLAVLAVGVLVVVELHLFTSVEMTPGFAVVLVVLSTMATAGVWTILQYASDVYFGTTLIETKTTLMWDLVYATGISIVGSPVFAVYFRWIESPSVREFAPGESG